LLALPTKLRSTPTNQWLVAHTMCRRKAENYAHTLDSLIDDRDDDLAKILVPIKNFLLNISNK
jgi:hypothetical protein